jgi:WD40 repeat protein
MTIPDHRFYVTGGSLPADNLSYVEREADRELYDALQLREFCYVLTARQMGKSSLMVRTAAKLREDGLRVAVLDLTAIGQNVVAEQWYYSLLCRLGEHLALEKELDDFWLQRERLGPLRRFMAALEQVVLTTETRRQGEGAAVVSGQSSVVSNEPSTPEHLDSRTPESPSLVIFIDEIDAVRSLPFPTDEFFAAIRECYNRRSETAALRQLTFCLLGTAAPTDLIRDTRMTPFNIGRRIELADFSQREAGPLAIGLEVGELGAPGRSAAAARSLLKRILYWTGGHPYLTQRLCQAVASETRDPRPAMKGERGTSLVDGLCGALFLARSAQEKDDNLIFVRERLLRSELDLAALLELYARVRRGKPVAYDATDPLCSVLRLSGIVRVSELPDRSPRLMVRNRIYARVFDTLWVAKRMPDAERRRQRAAYRRGLARATALSGVVVALLGGMAWTALRVADEAGDVLYVSQMNLAHLAHERDYVRAWRLLEQQRPTKGQADRRDFVWRYLWRLCRSQDRYTFPARAGEVNSVTFSPDGQVLAAGGTDGAIQLWDPAAKRLIGTVPAHRGASAATFSPDGSLLATMGQEDGTVAVWDLTSRPAALRHKLPGFRRPRARALFTPDGETLIAGYEDDTVRLWDLRSGRHTPPAYRTIPIRAAGPMAVSADGGTLAVCAAGPGGGVVTLWNIRSRNATRLPVSLPPAGGLVETVAFSPDGRLLATGSGSLILWDARTGSPLRTLGRHEGMIVSVAFSPNGRLLASSGLEGTIRLWNPGTPGTLATLRGHTGRIASIAFSPRGEVIASASRDGTVRLWDTDLRLIRAAERDRAEAEILSEGPDHVGAVAFSPDGTLLSEVRAKTVTLWDVAARGRVGPPLSREPDTGPSYLRRSCEFSPDGKLLATASGDGSVRLWDVGSHRAIGAIRGNPAVVTSMTFAGGGVLATANGGGSTGAEGSVMLWSAAASGGRPRRLGTLRADSRAPQGAVAVSPDRRTAAIASRQHRIELWDVSSLRRVAHLDGEVLALSLAFSPDGKLIAAGETEGSIYLWDRATRRRIRRLVGHVGPCLAVAFSPDGQTLASGGMDGTVRLWNPGVDEEEATLTGTGDFVWSVAFSPDGNLLATGSPDGKVRLWRAASFTETDAPRGASIPLAPRASARPPAPITPAR